MTKSTITRERLAKIKSWRETYGAGSNVMLPAEEAEELARMALAAMDSEPVAFTEKHEILNMHSTGLYLRAWPADRARNAVEGYTIPLYRHAQPVPVVPNEIKHRIGGLDWGWEGEFNRGWNACRAAMLQELKKSAGTEAICRSDENVQVLHTNSPAQSDCCPAQNSATPAQDGNSPVVPDGYVMVPDDLKEAAADLLATLDDYPEQLVPINRDSSVVRALRAAMLAAAPQEVGDA
ncbi:hypothetical protein ACQSJS_013070 [Klebsiella pneumoniae]